ncbi:putative tetrahydrofolylpolyglutamate synthase [Chaetomium fimeti]|uniref:tetrahydrofolate synthase n=1 Tax=Chaetomium fimeti TaxID=1854472 RepID=A0AAE0HDE2_9PEZI|nr:putative tetrahydrofolylpolyglutamate synthase [Chaetomium fimeti]
MSNTYQDAVELLRSRSRPWLRKQNPGRSRRSRPNNMGMREWLLELGHETSSFNIIHITGTKGKGSTAAFTDSLIRAHFHRLSRPVKVGLYTSPHLITERERIRINFEPLSEQVFAGYFFDVWNTLHKKAANDEFMPGYLQLLALTSMHAFKKEAVDVVIYEVHAGGRKDATNIFERPVACGFTTIGLDHADLLGDTIRSITWHKSGIMKPGQRAYSVIQQETVAREVLEEEAAKLDCPLQFVDTFAYLPEHPRLRLPAQKQNASLGIRLANAYLDTYNEKLSADDIRIGTSQCDWPGRFQRIQRGTHHWALDVAHNSLSLPVALEWFKSEVRSCHTRPEPRTALIFGHESARDTFALIVTIARFCEQHDFRFDLVILSPYKRYGLEVYDPVAEGHAGTWQTMQPLTEIRCASSLAEATGMVTERWGRDALWTLITGSTYLVGEALEWLSQIRMESLDI